MIFEQRHKGSKGGKSIPTKRKRAEVWLVCSKKTKVWVAQMRKAMETVIRGEVRELLVGALRAGLWK